MRENPPLMVLAEETPDTLTFRFNGKAWALTTLVLGVALLALVAKLFASSNLPHWVLAIVGVFGLLLLYSSVYSATADQWLTVSAARKTIRFHKKNLYGLIEWERLPQDFRSIQVGRYIRSSNWQIALVCNDGFELYLGENAFGALSYERAMNLAMKVTSRTGIISRQA